MNSGLYKITHKPSGRIYIGQSKNLRKRKTAYKNCGGSGNSNSVIRRAILKHGWDSFCFEVMVYVEGQEYLNNLEKSAIAAYGCLVPNGFNVEIGGNYSPMSESTKALLSEAKKGRRLSEEHKAKIGLASSKAWENASVERIQKTKEQAKNINAGKPLSDKTKAKLSAIRKQKFASGELVHHKPNVGRKFSEEVKQKMRESAMLSWAKRKGIQPCHT
jgi:group I intron endonuclease